MKKHNYKKERKILDKWISKNGAADFNLKERDIILPDGGLFSIEKETKVKPKTKMRFGKLFEYKTPNGKAWKGHEIKFIPIKRNGKTVKEKIDYYKAVFWFEDLDETINYFIRMKKMLKGLGYKTNRRLK
ncbi:MAG: hypothetical protein AABX54_02625 [Nanoarchaeota archaeon]